MKKSKILILIIVIFALCSKHQANTQEWSEPINISTMNGRNQNPDIYLDHIGILHCVWSHVLNDEYSNIYYSKSIDNGLTWTSPINVSMNIEKRPNNAKIVVDTEDNIYVSYDDDLNGLSNNKIILKIFNDTTWSLPDTISGDMLACSKNKMIIDNNDRIYVFWNHAIEGGNYYYRYLENGEWSEFYNPYGQDLVFLKVVVDTENNLHVLGGHSESGSYLDYFSYDLETNSWSEITTISQSTIALGYDIDLDGNNLPHFAWRQKTPSTPNPFEEDSTLYRYFNGTELTEPELVVEDPYDQKVQVISGKPYVMDWEKHENKAGNIVFYQKDSQNNWIGELVHSNASGIERMIKSDNMIHIILKSKINDDDINMYYMNRMIDTTTSIEEKNFNISAFNFFPNPFSTESNIQFTLNSKSLVLLKVYSFSGELITTVVNNSLIEGDYLYSWDGINNSGQKVKPGIYLIRLQAGNNIISRSIELINAYELQYS